MRRVIAGLFTLGVMFIAFLGGTTLYAAAPPYISNVSPTSGLYPLPVTISGSNFGATQGSSTVMFNGTTGRPTKWTASSIIVPVPSGATSGDIVVTVGGIASNRVTFTVVVAPSATTLSPSSGAAGTNVTITGTNFGSTAGTVTFNGVAANVTTWGATSITTGVPVGATTGQVVVVTSGGLPTVGLPFTILAPVITSVSPASDEINQPPPFTISGSNFGPCAHPSSATINGTPASIASWGPTAISALVPPGATSGNVVVTVGGVASNGVPFTIDNPFISSLSLTSGVVGTSVTIKGGNWVTSPVPVVKFNGTAAVVTNATASSIVTSVPVGATSGNVFVTSQNLISTTGVLFTVLPTVPPVANAGFGQRVTTGSTVQLDGTRSDDSTAKELSYSWSFVSVPAGSTATLSSATIPQPTFIADQPGSYTAQLVVNDGFANSNPSTVIISTQNIAPVANAGPNQTAQLLSTVQLNGSASTDANDSPLTYQWSFLSVPQGSAAVVANPSAVNPTFTVDKSGSYVVQLVVNDGYASSGASTVTVSTVNSPPVANAGPNQVVTQPGKVQLDGSGSTDVDGNSLTYTWSIMSAPQGSVANLQMPNLVQPVIYTDAVGTYVFKLVVNDGTVNSAPSFVVVTNGDVPPRATIGPAPAVQVGSVVSLDGSQSTSFDDSPLTYQWALLSKPAGSAATVSSPTTDLSSFTADVAGQYVVQLVVNDGRLGSMPATLYISTANSIPISNAGPNQTVLINTGAIQLSGSASHDPDGAALTYHWALLTQPSGSTAALSNATLVNPTFTPDKPGVYEVQLTVNNGSVVSAPSTVGVTVLWQDLAPQVNAGPNLTITYPNPVDLVGAASYTGLPNTALSILGWTENSGPGTVTFTNYTSPFTQAAFSTPGTYVLQLTASDSQLTGCGTVIVNVDSAAIPATTTTVSLAPTMAGPDVTGTSQTMIATVTQTGTPLANASVQFAVSGANSATGTVDTNSSGIATFSYIGANQGSDTVEASSGGSVSNTASVAWVALTQPVSTSTVTGKFFLSPNSSASFDTPATATPVFTQTFPTINFNPPVGTVQQITVQGQTVPWLLIPAPLNSAYTYTNCCPALNPVSVAVTPGELITVNYVSGLWSISNPIGTTYGYSGNPFGSWDANGNPNVVNGSGAALPGAHSAALVGGFATATGQLIGAGPILIGNSFSGVVPAGATQLLMGMNDGTDFADNSGAVVVNVTLTTSGGINPITGVGLSTHPFTDVMEDSNGNFTGTIVAQGEGVQAGGVGPLYAFQGVFEGTLAVPQAGNVNLNIFSDAGFVLGVGGGAQYVSGPMTNPPANGLTTFEGLPVIGAYNASQLANNVIVAYFPAAGVYPYELDYADSGAAGGPIEPQNDFSSLVMSVGEINNPTVVTVVPPAAGSLTLTPISVTTQTVGSQLSFSVQATNASGVPVPNVGVTLVVNGANIQNTQSLTGTTNSSGQVSFSYTGTNGGLDTVQAWATISGMATLSNVVSVPWTIPSGSGGGCSVFYFTPQGWITAPAIGALVQTPTPITLAAGITLTSGTLKMFPSANPNQVIVLNPNTTGTGPLTLGTIDPTLLANGENTIQLEATSSTGACQLNEIVVSVAGEYKPGREKVTVTDFKVPLAGIPINISRIYDSLNRGTVGDFGNGWNLGTNVQLSVDQLLNVTFTLDGKAQTFYFTPQSSGNALFPWAVTPAYTPQPGVHGRLTSNGCDLLIYVGGALVQDGAGVVCFPGNQTYAPTTYTYTDPAGRVYTMTSAGVLQTIQDLNGNLLTFTPNGITGSVGGVVVPFVRDSQGRITQITDLNLNNYAYTYDTPCGSGNLCTVTFPTTPAGTGQATYTYFTDHSLKTQIDPNSNTTTYIYYSSSDDGGNSSLDGRLESVTGPSVTGTNGSPTQYVTKFSYNVTTNTTITTNPDLGTVTETDDSFGNPLTIVDPLNNTSTFTYYGSGDPTGSPAESLKTYVDPLQNPATTYTYDTNGFLTSLTDPLQHTTTWKTNPYGGVTSTTDAAKQNTTTIGYDQYFNPTTSSDSFSSTIPLYTRTYDSAGQILTQQDANGNPASVFTYDSQENLQLALDALKEKTSYTYDSMDRVLSRTDPDGNQTIYGYDALGNLKSITDGAGNLWQSTYDLNGNKLSDTDPLNHKTTYQYDNLNRLTEIIYQDTTTKKYTYDFRNNKLSETDQLGRTTQYVYDLDGHLKTVTYALNTADAGTVQYIYDADGNLKTVTDENGNPTTYYYDPANRLQKVVDARQDTTQYGYDADNRRTSMIDANINPQTTYGYDLRSRLNLVTHPDTTTDKYVWDGVGNQKSATDQAQQTTYRTYDLVNRLQTVTDAVGNLTQYGYDLAGNLTTITDANKNVTTFKYDKLNRVQYRILPLGMQGQYAYNKAGYLSTLTDFNSKVTTYTYDTLNRLLTKKPDASFGAPSIVFTYNSDGTRKTMTDASGKTTYTYDNRMRVKAKATPEGTLSYTYDAHGNVLTILSSNTNGASVTYTPDQLNRVGTVTDNRLIAQGVSSAVTTYSYYPVGTIQNYGYSTNGVQTAYTYDTLNRLKSIAASKGSSALSSYTYSPFPALTQTVSELNGRNVSYGYDKDYHLQSETITADPAGNNGVESYTYDPVGNRKTLNSTIKSLPGSMSYSYDNNDRFTIPADSYDANGNTLMSGGISNTYDFENRMLTHGAVTMVYDGDGNRVSETAGGATTTYLVDRLNPTGYSQVLDELVAGVVQKTYTCGLQRISENQLASGKWTPTFYGYDGHGNARFLANSAGTVTDTYTFDAFGAQIASTGTTPNPYLYSGERFDSSLNLYHLRARYYNMLTGRFETMDPGKESCCTLRASQVGNIFDPATLHKYVYTGNNPVNRIDPSGKDAILDYAIELGEEEKTVEELRLVGLAVRDELVTACIEVNMAALEAEGVPTLAAYNLAKALCIALID